MAMDRRGFLKKSIFTLGSLATVSLMQKPLMAYGMNKASNQNKKQNMKKIIIIDGGPRRNMNTAQMLQKFVEGAQSVGEHIEVKTFRLYDLDYKGCMSCMSLAPLSTSVK